MPTFAGPGEGGASVMFELLVCDWGVVGVDGEDGDGIREPLWFIFK